MLISAPFNKEHQQELSELIKATAFGGNASIERHLVSLNTDEMNIDHIILGITTDTAISGWLSMGALKDIDDNVSLVRIYLDCIFIKKSYRGRGIAALAIERAAELLSSLINKFLPNIGNKAIPLDIEFSAKYINSGGEACVRQFGETAFKSISYKLSDSSYVVREFIDESTSGL